MDKAAKAREIAIAIDEWIEEVHSANHGDDGISPEDILASFQRLCTEFQIPPDIAKNAVARALGVPSTH